MLQVISAFTIFSGLIFNSRELDDTLTLADYLIKKESTIQLRKQRSAIALSRWFPMQFFVSPEVVIRNIYWRRPKSLTTTRRLSSPSSTLFMTRYCITGSLPLMAMMSALGGLSQTSEKWSISPLPLLLSTTSDRYFWSRSSPHLTST